MLQAGIETLRELLTQCLYEESVSHWYTADGFKSLFALIGTNGQGIGTRYALTALGQRIHSCSWNFGKKILAINLCRSMWPIYMQFTWI